MIPTIQQNAALTSREHKSSGYRDKEWLLMDICTEYQNGLCNDAACPRAHCIQSETMKRDRHSNRIFICFQHLKGECKVKECRYYHAMEGQKRGINQTGRIRQMEFKRKEAYESEIKRLYGIQETLAPLLATTAMLPCICPSQPTSFSYPAGASATAALQLSQARPLFLGLPTAAAFTTDPSAIANSWSTAGKVIASPLHSVSSATPGQLQLFSDASFLPFYQSSILPLNCMTLVPGVTLPSTTTSNNPLMHNVSANQHRNNKARFMATE